MARATADPAELAGLKPVRLLVVDDHEVVQWGFRLLLEKQSWVERCAAARTPEEALGQIPALRPHVALVDLFLAKSSGAELCQEIRDRHPSTRVLLISGAGSVSPAVAKAAGASGFVSKGWGAADVVQAVRMVALGMQVFTDSSGESPIDLSDREREVIALVATGCTNQEIADRLFLSPHTVKDHASAIYRKLAVRNRAEAVREAQRLGLIG